MVEGQAVFPQRVLVYRYVIEGRVALYHGRGSLGGVASVTVRGTIGVGAR